MKYLPLLIILIASCIETTLAQSTQDTLAELSRKLDVLADEVARMKLGEVDATAPGFESGLGPAASRIYTLAKPGVSIAGYGEIVFEKFSKKRDDNAESNAKARIDFLRNVIYVGYRFNDWILLNTEIEYEHASTGKGGEVSVEFGYIELVLSEYAHVRAGMVLVPVGIINEQHEPTTFFGTLRPDVERVIIPTTWRGIGAGAYGNLAPNLKYRAYVVEGLKASDFSSSSGIRGGRQSGALAVAEDFGVTGRLEFEPIPEISLGISGYYGNSGQGFEDSLGPINAATGLYSSHAIIRWRGLEVRGLYAGVSVGDADRVSTLSGSTIGSSMAGWYVSAGYDLLSALSPGTEQAFTPYIIYEQFDTQKEVPEGFTRNEALDRTNLVFGLMYQPVSGVAFKVDYRDAKNAAGTAVDQLNLAVNFLY